jgi:hypothetical protein
MSLKRNIKKFKKSNNKKIINAKAVESKEGIKFRSKLEFFTYSKLNESGIKDFSYEKEKFTLLEGFVYPEDSIESFETTKEGLKTKHFEPYDSKIRPMTYLPDFTCIDHSTKTGWIIECKGYNNDALIRRALIQ